MKVVIVTVALILGVIGLVGVLVGEPISMSIGFDAVNRIAEIPSFKPSGLYRAALASTRNV